jgi:aconitase A
LPFQRSTLVSSPSLVVARVLGATVDIDRENEPVGNDTAGKQVFPRELLPNQGEIADAIAQSMSPEAFQQRYGKIEQGPPAWRTITAKKSDPFGPRIDRMIAGRAPLAHQSRGGAGWARMIGTDRSTQGPAGRSCHP